MSTSNPAASPLSESQNKSEVASCAQQENNPGSLEIPGPERLDADFLQGVRLYCATIA